MTDNPYRTGAIFLMISAALHIFAPAVGGLAQDALKLIPFGLAYFLIAAGLMRGWRWLAYIAFIIMLIGISAAIAGYFGPSTIPGWWFLAILAANALAALTLLAALWRSKPAIGG